MIDFLLSQNEEKIYYNQEYNGIIDISAYLRDMYDIFPIWCKLYKYFINQIFYIHILSKYKNKIVIIYQNIILLINFSHIKVQIYNY